MELTKENKEKIESLTHYQLLSKWRFAAPGNEWMQGDTGKYWGERMAELRFKDPKQAVCDSKSLSF